MKHIKQLKPIVRNIGKVKILENGLKQFIVGGESIVDEKGYVQMKNGKYLFKNAISMIMIPHPLFDEPTRKIGSNES